MAKCLKNFIFFFLLSFSSISFASSDFKEIQFLDTLIEKGYVSADKKNEIVENLLPSISETSFSYTEYFTIINTVKLIAVLLLLYTFRGLIYLGYKKFQYLFGKIPVVFYQLCFLSISIFSTLFPKEVWESQSYWVLVLSSFINMTIIFWIFATNDYLLKLFETIVNKLEKKFFFINNGTIILFILFTYYSTLTYVFNNSIFGYLSLILLYTLIIVSITTIEPLEVDSICIISSFTILALGGVLYYVDLNYFKVNFSSSLIYVTSIFISIIIFANNIHSLVTKEFLKNIFILIIYSIIGAYIYQNGFYIFSSILFISIILSFISLLLYFSQKIHLLITTGLLGVILYSSAIFFEKYSIYFIFQ